MHLKCLLCRPTIPHLSTSYHWWVLLLVICSPSIEDNLVVALVCQPHCLGLLVSIFMTIYLPFVTNPCLLLTSKTELIWDPWFRHRSYSSHLMEAEKVVALARNQTQDLSLSQEHSRTDAIMLPCDWMDRRVLVVPLEAQFLCAVTHPALLIVTQLGRALLHFWVSCPFHLCVFAATKMKPLQQTSQGFVKTLFNSGSSMHLWHGSKHDYSDLLWHSFCETSLTTFCKSVEKHTFKNACNKDKLFVLLILTLVVPPQQVMLNLAIVGEWGRTMN